MAPFPKTARKLLFVLPFVMLVFVALIVLMPGRSASRTSLPNPNGYDDFVKAASLITGELSDAATLDQDSLRALVTTNAESLRILRIGLSRRCSVPTDIAITNFTSIMGDLVGQKHLAQLLAAEGRLAELDNRLADAQHSYLDAIRLGIEVSRGGLLINRMVGLACEGLGIMPLVKLVPKLDCEQQRELVLELHKTDSTAVSWDEVFQAEKRFMRSQMRTIRNPLKLVAEWWQNRIPIKRTELKHKRMAACLRLLEVEVALRCYRAEQGQAPASLAQLVPQRLPSVPLDPFTSQPLIYRPQGTNWLLYSVDVDGTDDGGKPVGRSSSITSTKGDLFFDSLW